MVGSPLERIAERMAATILVVVLALGDGVVDVNGRDFQAAVAGHFHEAMHASSSFFGDTMNASQQFRILFMQQTGKIATIVQYHVRAPAVRTLNSLLDTPPVFCFRLTFPGKNGDTGCCDSRRGLILGGEDIARGPTHFRTEGHQGLDQNGSLDGHVDTARNTRTFEGLLRLIFAANGHKCRHFGLGNAGFFASPVSKGDISDFVISRTFEHSIHVSDSLSMKASAVLPMGSTDRA
jgi:hypothetical protein